MSMVQCLQMCTLSDIARAADVSVTTVSLVLSNTGRISSEVRNRVLSVAADLGYFHEKEKLNQTRSDRTVGLLYSFDTNWSDSHRLLSPLVVAIEETLSEQGIYMTVITFARTMETEAILKRITHARPTGVISVNFADEDIFTHLENTAVPVVLANNLEFQDLFYTAGVDDFQGTYDATRHLLNLGHRNIAYFDYPDGTFHPMANRRYYGYWAALEESGVPVRDEFRIRVDVHDRASLECCVSALLGGPEKPTAFVSDDDNLMASVWHVAADLGIRIPDDVSVIANGDTQDYDRADTPPMTTMRINTGQLGKLAAEMMIKRLNNQLDEIQVVKLKEQLIDRGSCRAIEAK